MEAKNKTVFGVILAAIFGVIATLGGHAISAALVGKIRFLGYGAYAVHFLAGMALAWIILTFRHTKAIVWCRWWLSQKLETKFYLQVRKWGTIPLVFFTCFFASPALAAVAILLLNVETKTAWKYIGYSMAFTSLFWVSVYLGLIRVVFG